MVKLVIAGRSNCPFFAKVQLLAEKLQTNLPHFSYHQIVKTPDEWNDWIMEICAQNDWNHVQSPIIWRELVDRGGKGSLIGGSNEFQEYVKAYYGIESDMMSAKMSSIAEENYQEKIKQDIDLQTELNKIRLEKVCISVNGRVALEVAYHVTPQLSKGILGSMKEVHLVLHAEFYPDSCPDNVNAAELHGSLDGLQMETIDLAGAAIRRTSIVQSRQEAFSGCSLVVLIHDLPKRADETHEEWVLRSSAYFEELGRSVDEYCSTDTRVALSCNGLITVNLMVLAEQLHHINRRQILGVGRLLENQARAVLGRKMQQCQDSEYRKRTEFPVCCANLKNIIVWGTPSEGQCYVDLSRAVVIEQTGAIREVATFTVPLKGFIYDPKWLEKEFSSDLAAYSQRRVHATGPMRVLALSSFCAARAIALADLLEDWFQGSDPRWISSVVCISDGWYDVPSGMACCFPTTFQPVGCCNVVQDINMDDVVKQRMAAIVQDLLNNRYILHPDERPPSVAPAAQQSAAHADAESKKLRAMTEAAEGEMDETEGEMDDVGAEGDEGAYEGAVDGGQLQPNAVDVEPNGDAVGEAPAAPPANTN